MRRVTDHDAHAVEIHEPPAVERKAMFERQNASHGGIDARLREPAFPHTVDDRLNGQVWVTVVATGFGGRGRRPRGDAWAPPAEQRRPQGEGNGDLDVPSFLKN